MQSLEIAEVVAAAKAEKARQRAARRTLKSKTGTTNSDNLTRSLPQTTDAGVDEDGDAFMSAATQLPLSTPTSNTPVVGLSDSDGEETVTSAMDIRPDAVEADDEVDDDNEADAGDGSPISRRTRSASAVKEPVVTPVLRVAHENKKRQHQRSGTRRTRGSKVRLMALV